MFYGGELMSTTEKVLYSKPVKDALIEGIFVWIDTGDINQGWDKMISVMKKNGSYITIKFAILLDIAKSVTR